MNSQTVTQSLSDINFEEADRKKVAITVAKLVDSEVIRAVKQVLQIEDEGALDPRLVSKKVRNN